VTDGDTVYVQLVTAAAQDTTTDLTLSIGGVSDTFSATTYGNALFSDSFESGYSSAWSSTTP
jgi:hypothetical protein